MSYDDAVSPADEAIAARDWERAIALLKAATARLTLAATSNIPTGRRYHLAFCYYMNKQYYEANVLAEHLARRYPQGGLSPKATEIGMQALAEAYNAYTEVDRSPTWSG